MPNVVDTGYLEGGYLEDEYLLGQVTWGVWSQIDRRIDSTKHVLSQTEQVIADTHNVNEQIAREITVSRHVLCQVDRRIDAVHSVHEQINQAINDTHEVHEQINRTINAIHTVRSQVDRRIDATHNVRSQVDRQVGSTHHVRSEINRGKILHADCSGYLVDDYLAEEYLSGTRYCVHLWSQVDRRLDKIHSVHEQIERRIDATHHVRSQIQRRIDAIHSVHEQIDRRIEATHHVRSQIERRLDKTRSVREQVERRIDAIKNIHSQIDRLRAHTIHSQITRVLYNTNQLRILCDFPSRGLTGINWTANSTMAGDFSVNNLNTDIVEQVWRSNTGVKTGLNLTVDTEISQGIFADTLGILNHNLTTSASITWEGSNDAGFASVGFSEVLISTTGNIYWVAPTLPTTSFRYWRFLISDGTNTNDYLEIGTILFGSAAIFQGECFVDRVTRTTTHFADKIQTEGFTNVSNDRALKFAVGLEFRNLDYTKGNYQRLREIFENDRTSLKCLWIPTPEYAARFAVFGKLASIPVETHNVKGQFLDYVDLELTVDEAL